MICPHGMESAACPVCRLSNKTMPPINLEIEDSMSKLLEPLNPAIREISRKRAEIEKLLTDNKPNLRVNTVSMPPSFGIIPINEPPMHKRIEELNSGIPKEINTHEDISIELPDGKIKKVKKT